MGYKALGFVVWHGAKLFIRKHHSVTPTKEALAGVGAAAVIAGVVLAGRRASNQGQQ